MSRALRIIWVTGGIALIVSGASGLSETYSRIAKLDSLRAAPPICLPLDLSARGVYSGYYRRSYAAVLDDQLRLVIAGSPSADDTKKALSGLSVLMVLQDDSGRVLTEQAVGDTDFHQWNARVNPALVVTLRLDKVNHAAGNYQLSIEVKSPAQGMAERPHCIVAEYGLSGMEATILYWIGAPINWMALALGITLLVMRWRKRQKGLEAAAAVSEKTIKTDIS